MATNLLDVTPRCLRFSNEDSLVDYLNKITDVESTDTMSDIYVALRYLHYFNQLECKICGQCNQCDTNDSELSWISYDDLLDEDSTYYICSNTDSIIHYAISISENVEKIVNQIFFKCEKE